MQRQRQEERESFQQAQRQYSSLPRYSTHLHSVLPELPWLLHLTHGGQRGTAVDGRGCLASRPSYYVARRLERKLFQDMPTLSLKY